MDSNRRPAGHTALPRTECRRKGLWVPALGSGVPSQAPVVPPRTSPVNEAGAGAGAGGEAMHGGEEDDSCHMRPHWAGARGAGGGRREEQGLGPPPAAGGPDDDLEPCRMRPRRPASVATVTCEERREG